ncbi:serine hydrolase domain-containing protein [Pseudooceanicola sp. C21-150M6]|uniref:serine hydrolase domain-containing protein n=1 Tax=Pseudooceanicola sp. C21-150M6 TaxID=3434355 RepID=UPI003D7F7BB0
MLLLLLAAPLRADDAARAAAFRDAFQGWMAGQGARTGAIAIRHDNAPVAAFGINTDPDLMRPLASLSKMITALCVARLVADRQLSYDTEVRKVLNLPQAAPITTGALLSHATGLQHDRTQGPMSWWRGDPTPRWPEVTPPALDPGRLTPGTPDYYYSNENYAVLGTIIEGVTHEGYETACRDRVLTPAGVTARPDPLFAAYLPWGGWRMSVADYAQLMDYAVGDNGILPGQIDQLPAQQVFGPVTYTMGLFRRDMGAGSNFWHFGSLCFEDGPNLGAYTAHWETGWTVTVWYDACLEEAGMISLDQALVAVAYAIP